jgi:hypothetical protein
MYNVDKTLSVQARYSKFMPLIVAHATMAVLDTWTVIHVTATKFKILIFSLSGFALPNIADAFI